MRSARPGGVSPPVRSACQSSAKTKGLASGEAFILPPNVSQTAIATGFFRRCAVNAKPAKPISIIAQVDGSGTPAACEPIFAFSRDYFQANRPACKPKFGSSTLSAGAVFRQEAPRAAFPGNAVRRAGAGMLTGGAALRPRAPLRRAI